MTRIYATALAPLLLLLLLTACAGGRPVTATHYGPAGLFGGYGERIVEPGVWRVNARSNGVAQAGFGRNMAMHRAAELVKAAGFSHMQILDQRGRATMMNQRQIGESMELLVRGANDPAPPADCRARQPEHCFTAPVDTVLASLRPLLHIDQPAQ